MTYPPTDQTPAADRGAVTEEALFVFLSRKYVQRADDRQRSMGLQYTSAETHDLAKEIARFVSAALAAPPSRDGGDTGASPDSRQLSPQAVSASGFDPARSAAPHTADEIRLLLEECRGWHQALDGREAGDGAITIRCENGESEQARLNLRATLRDVGTVLAGILSRVSDEHPTGEDAPAAEGQGLASAAGTATPEPKDAETISAEAYQVIGSLADDAGRFGEDEIIRALDYFGYDQWKEPGKEILPFVLKPSPDPRSGAVAAGTEPEGWQLVPVEPIEEMIYAKCDAELRYQEPGASFSREFVDRKMRAGYRAMLAAAPRFPAPETGGETFETIARWGEETFGPILPERIFERASEEMDELRAEPSRVEEAADVVIVLLRYPGLWEAVQRKMAVNRARKWILRGDGTGYHVKDLPAPPTQGAGR